MPNSISPATPFESQPGIIFLGLAERVAYVREGNTNLFKWNVLGLKHTILSNIYPMRLNGWSVGLAFLLELMNREHKLILTDETGKDVGFINISANSTKANDAEMLAPKQQTQLLVPQKGWATAFLPLGDATIVIEKPGTYYVNYADQESCTVVAQLHFILVDPPPLTPERIAAIKSDPLASKAVRVELGCNHCPTKYRVYAALDKSQKSEDDGWIWYRDIPDTFTCSCGKANLPLEIIRRNLHGFLGMHRDVNEELNFIPLYERSSLETLRSAFSDLLTANPKEESLQTFIEDNPILFHQFPSFSLFSKPPILTSFVADFALVTPKKELLLIELEKTTTRLMKKDGGVAAELGHAFDQVRNWLHLVDEHRLAVLDALKIDRADVSVVRGVVIAGRDVGYDALHLRRLKGEDRGRLTFLTYDDLLFSLDSLIHRMGQL